MDLNRESFEIITMMPVSKVICIYLHQDNRKAPGDTDAYKDRLSRKLYMHMPRRMHEH